jgi:hypothetical protein
MLLKLYGTAVVEGASRTLRTCTSTLEFAAPPFHGGLHQIDEWRYLDDCSERELALEPIHGADDANPGPLASLQEAAS